MSTTTITKKFKVDGILADPTSFTVAAATGVYGVRRQDTGAVVVASGIALVRDSLGIYHLSWEDPAAGLVYEYVLRCVYAGETHYFAGIVVGGSGPDYAGIYDLVPLVQPYCAQAPEPLIQQELRNAADELCRKSFAWAADVVLTLVADQAVYTMTAPYGGRITHVMRAWDEDKVPVPTYYDQGNTLTLGWLPGTADEGKTLTVRVAVRPVSLGVLLPSVLLSDYGRGIAAGARARLQSQAGEPWFSPAWSLQQREFDEAVDDARRISMQGRVTGPTALPRRAFL